MHWGHTAKKGHRKVTTFNQPQDTGNANGGFFKPKDNDGDLVLFLNVWEKGVEFDQMSNRDREFVIVDYANLDRDAVVIEKAKVTHAALVRKLPVDATNILGRIGSSKTSNGYNAWVLAPHTDADAKKATAWLKAGKPSAPDPFANLEREAAKIGVTVDQLIEIKKMQAGSSTGEAPF